MIQASLDADASPLGWINDGDYQTVGNNVDVRRNWGGGTIQYREFENDPNALDYRPSSFPDRVFSPFFHPEGDPKQDNSDAAVVQAFYWCNWMHDRLYQLGFTEAAGNYQFENEFNGVNRGGVGFDPILVDVQWGANMFPEPEPEAFILFFSLQDGVAPRMQLRLFPGGNPPKRDPALDAEVILHEYTHALSQRLVGGGTGIFGGQYGGMGEGWSDFMALALLGEAQDDLGGNWAAGAYTSYLIDGSFAENYYYGIRRYPYSTDLTKNPLTFKDIDPPQADPHTGVPRTPWAVPNSVPANEVHNSGEVWAAALWELRASLLEAFQGSFQVRNDKVLQLVVDGMNLTPPQPTFLQARDAILLADEVLNAGQNRNRIWTAFAKRGMGYSAEAPDGNTTAGIVESSDMPPSGPLWMYGADDAILSSPAVGPDGAVYFGSAAGRLFALNKDGSKRWDVDLQFTTGTLIDSSPAIGPDASIYIGVSGFDLNDVSGRLYAVTAEGAVKWYYAVPDMIESSPAISSDGTIYFGCWDGKLYALNPDGTLRWTYTTDGALFSSPAIDLYGKVLIGSVNGNLYFVRTNGTLLWMRPYGSDYSSPAINSSAAAAGLNGAGTIYSASLQNGKVYALDTGTGLIRWQFQAGGSIYSSPVVDVDGNVYFGSVDGKVYSLAPDGALRWTFQTDGSIYSTPALSRHRVYCGSFDGKLYVLNAATGLLIASHTTGDAIFSSPAVGTEGRVYVGGLDSKLYTFELDLPTDALDPSPWPMFRNDPRRLGNQGAMWFESGTLSSDGVLNMVLRSSKYPIADFVDFNNNLSVDWSSNLKDWRPRSTLGFFTEGRRAFSDVVAIDRSSYFIRGRVPNYPNLRFRNPYGFIKVSVPPGISLISNPLNTHDNTLAGLFPQVPDGTTLSKYGGQGWNINTFDSALGGWDPEPNTTLLPGEGGVIFNPSAEPFEVTFIGEVLQGYLAAPLPAGFYTRGSMVPQEGGLTTLLGFGPEDGLSTGDQVLRLINLRSDYVTYTYNTGTGWSRTDPAPVISLQPRPFMGEALFFNTTVPRTWARNYSVWP